MIKAQPLDFSICYGKGCDCCVCVGGGGGLGAVDKLLISPNPTVNSGAWPCAGVGMTIVGGNVAVACVESRPFLSRLVPCPCSHCLCCSGIVLVLGPRLEVAPWSNGPRQSKGPGYHNY